MLYLLAMALAPQQADLTLDRMIRCQSLHEIWQWDEHDAGRKVPKDDEWFIPFHRKLLAAAEAAGIGYEEVARRSNALSASFRPHLNAEQQADWKQCQAETGWKPNANGETYDI